MTPVASVRGVIRWSSVSGSPPLVALAPQGGSVVSDAVIDSLFPETALTRCSFKAARVNFALLHGDHRMVLVPLRPIHTVSLI